MTAWCGHLQAVSQPGPQVDCQLQQQLRPSHLVAMLPFLRCCAAGPAVHCTVLFAVCSCTRKQGRCRCFAMLIMVLLMGLCDSGAVCPLHDGDGDVGARTSASTACRCRHNTGTLGNRADAPFNEAKTFLWLLSSRSQRKRSNCATYQIIRTCDVYSSIPAAAETDPFHSLRIHTKHSTLLRAFCLPECNAIVAAPCRDCPFVSTATEKKQPLQQVMKTSVYGTTVHVYTNSWV